MAFENSCKGTVGPQYPKTDESVQTKPGCSPNATQTGYCPTKTKDPSCRDFQLTENRDSCFIEGVVDEALGIAGANLNIYKLLGVHEQCKTVDATGNGQAISNGDAVGFPAENAFNNLVSEWRSVQTGDGVTASAFIGYDFGVIKTLDGSRPRYSVEANVRKHITALAIKQSSDSNKRVTKARIERSDDGKKWYGTAIVTLPDDDCLNTVLFGDSSNMRYWRLRPLEFNGKSTDNWGVQALQLFHNYLATNIDNIQDKIFLENRDRDYATDPITLKGSYDLTDIQLDLTEFGGEIPSLIMYITISFASCVQLLGRPIVIGDIIEVPSEAQYSPEMKRILRWVEVTDVSWSTEGYTPGWKPTLLRVIAQPAIASQETQDIFGDLAETELPEELGLIDGKSGSDDIYQDYADVHQTIMNTSKDMVPEAGADATNTIRAWEDEELQAAEDQGLTNLQKIGLNPTGLYVEDALPPNNAPYTEGTEFPDNPQNGDYHRLTYEGLSQDIPPRLYRFSTQKNRWIYLETDRREEYNPNTPRLQEFVTAPTKRDISAVSKPPLYTQCDEED